MSGWVQDPEKEFRSKLSETSIKKSDLEAVEYVVDALDEYACIRSQGPVWLTGSALENSDYNDIDIVVERKSLEESKEELNTAHDHKAIYDMLVDSERYDIDEDRNPLEALILAEDLNVKIMGSMDFPVNRYEFEFDGTEFDINFCHSQPNDGGMELTPFYQQDKMY